MAHTVAYKALKKPMADRWQKCHHAASGSTVNEVSKTPLQCTANKFTQGECGQNVGEETTLGTEMEREHQGHMPVGGAARLKRRPVSVHS